MQFISIYKEQINLSFVNNVVENNNDPKMDEFLQLIGEFPNTLIKLDDTIFEIKNTYSLNMENLINEIQMNLDNLDKKENRNDNYNIFFTLIDKIISEKKYLRILKKIKLIFLQKIIK